MPDPKITPEALRHDAELLVSIHPDAPEAPFCRVFLALLEERDTQAKRIEDLERRLGIWEHAARCAALLLSACPGDPLRDAVEVSVEWSVGTTRISGSWVREAREAFRTAFALEAPMPSDPKTNFERSLELLLASVNRVVGYLDGLADRIEPLSPTQAGGCRECAMQLSECLEDVQRTREEVTDAE